MSLRAAGPSTRLDAVAAPAAPRASGQSAAPAGDAAASPPPWWGRVNVARLVSGAAVFALALFLNGFRHSLAPDFHVDELIYASVGQNLATGHGLSVQGQPFFWQPPLMFLLEWPIVRLFGLGGVNTFDAALQLRLVNGAIGAATAVGILWLGWRLRGFWTGWAMAVLFMTDPFVIRVTRRFYIEPFAALWVLLALYACHASLGRWTWRRRLGVGVLFGLAVLTKELAAYALVIPVLLWVRREVSWKEPFTIAATAAATYCLYVLWALLEGTRSYFIDLKRFQYDHLVGAVHFNGFNRPGVSLTQSLLDNAGDYWTSYVCIALAAPATVWLWFRGDRTGRFLALWSAVSYGFIAALGKFGSLEDQFFYFLMPPVLCVIGYVYAYRLPVLVEILGRAWRSRRPVRIVNAVNVSLVALIVALTVVSPNVQVWVLRFGTGVDSGYSGLVGAINANVPAGSIIDSPGGSSEELKFSYPDGQYNLLRALDPSQLRSQRIQWYVLRSKDVKLANGIDQPYYDYITSHAVRIWGVNEHTYFDFGLWYVANPSALPDVTFPLPAKAPTIQLPQPGP